MHWWIAQGTKAMVEEGEVQEVLLQMDRELSDHLASHADRGPWRVFLRRSDEESLEIVANRSVAFVQWSQPAFSPDSRFVVSTAGSPSADQVRASGLRLPPELAISEADAVRIALMFFATGRLPADVEWREWNPRTRQMEVVPPDAPFPWFGPVVVGDAEEGNPAASEEELSPSIHGARATFKIGIRLPDADFEKQYAGLLKTVRTIEGVRRIEGEGCASLPFTGLKIHVHQASKADLRRLHNHLCRAIEAQGIGITSIGYVLDDMFD